MDPKWLAEARLNLDTCKRQLLSNEPVTAADPTAPTDPTDPTEEALLELKQILVEIINLANQLISDEVDLLCGL